VGKRKLFDRARKEVWLEWFAATCNLRLSAEKAGVHEKTVGKHLLNDRAFFEAAQRALQLGYFRLEARSVQEAHAPASDVADGSGVRPTPTPPCQGGEPAEYEVRVLDEAAAEEHFDPALAMQLLRENRRHLPGAVEKRAPPKSTATAATNAEIAKALARRLKGFALRQDSGSNEG
jgi:hypothetical protein